MPSLKLLLAFDALTCAVMAIVLIAGAPLLETVTGIPQMLSLGAGVLLIPSAFFIGLVAMRFSSLVPAVMLVIAGNGAWVAASLVIVAAGLTAPNSLGVAFILVQAAAVTLLTLLEFSALRSIRPQLS
ncbi:hypothetical protein [uncultured Roseibium sp.]|uniref:hypothetical protein n=1 Tax=uncultured Roseibium sp. TaxID=1936171 RepID=UPI00262601BB|nr:hypothetical protein [uncultured Roseibium sp.]